MNKLILGLCTALLISNPSFAAYERNKAVPLAVHYLVALLVTNLAAAVVAPQRLF